MRALFGVVSLLVALAIVGILVARQFHAVRGASPVPSPQADAASATVREQAQNVQQRVRDDVNQALQQGAARRDEADK